MAGHIKTVRRIRRAGSIKAAGHVMALCIVCVLMAGCLTGCGNRAVSGEDPAGIRDISDGRSASDGEDAPDCGKMQELSGSIRMAGSTSMEKLAGALAESFMEKYPDVNVTVEFVGSGAGIQAVLSGTVDIGNASRSLRAEEKTKGAVETIVAMDGIAVCTNPDNGVGGLTKQQLADIYTGAVKNWSEVGGEDSPIVVIGHEAGSGTREAFEELLGVEDLCAYANELGSSGAVAARIASTPGAVGYVSLDVTDDSITLLALEGVEPTAENIKAGSYFLSRPLFMVTKGKVSQQSDLVQAWFEHVLGGEGRRVAEQMGLIAAD